jgi:hypothetical protein
MGAGARTCWTLLGEGVALALGLLFQKRPNDEASLLHVLTLRVNKKRQDCFI